MRITLIKFLIALLPTAPVANDFLSEVEDVNTVQTDENVDDSKTMDSVVKSYNGSYPMIYNIDETNVKVGDSFDPLAGVYAVDSVSEVTENITTSGEVDTNTPGDYYVAYKVTGNDGAWYEITRIVHVGDNETSKTPAVPKRSNSKSSGNRVTFKNAQDLTIQKGSEFNPTENLTVIDTDGNDITKDVHVTGDNVDTEKPGTYYIAYTVLDRFNKPNATAVKVTVE